MTDNPMIHIGKDQYGRNVWGQVTSIDYWRYVEQLDQFEVCIAGHIIYLEVAYFHPAHGYVTTENIKNEDL